ncbi:hypothetical protein GLOIN_2v1526357 [Rhizophagus irregularis DAOM 181602=DAOM 197198]|uniref:Uncharacterized protein n=1 Tax=Rhizophagus irregularis (strain DAOM 181602 / DAOM 197198 / MUCL 43194) TaxID=747089 RepID=A0A2P4QPF1_RHIID|nr:hypothetical protein GLOIN_2v1526357 [Rhizophagus irregularis DAOM 181602=DAOM 197198]POG79537.1 hypothetical protein GLOIN_2v1526357 [Rhizophagus irregularis DAOM 181602=DAOM 197198]GET57343.1 hypothetical protein GLOIN_2v1526357 [Rhizophagus irregularis DAOM 181602=DAOM 197198]CAB5382191.1 unnamed protein product [Rhizophagus irregularis]|eukprot:XP_025186403.1 hypothetical protein GLOIN_2v1526357 [Rhizophagus irregularis DAOM 181602=DAOM 197198]
MVVQAVAQAVLLASFLILAIRRLRACVLKLYFRSSFDFCFEGSVFLISVNYSMIGLAVAVNCILILF